MDARTPQVDLKKEGLAEVTQSQVQPLCSIDQGAKDMRPKET